MKLLVQELRLMKDRLAATQQQQAADQAVSQEVLQSLRRASEDEKLEYERLLETAFSHKSKDEALLQQRLAASQGATACH